MAEASNDPVDPDIYSLSSSEAAAVLDARAGDFRPAPAPLTPSNASEARQRVAELSADPAFLKAYFAGDVEARKQMDALNEMIAGATDADVLSGGQDASLVEVTTGQNVRRGDLLSWAGDMRQLWGAFSPHAEAAIADLLDPNTPVPADVLQMVQRGRMQDLNNPEFIARLNSGDAWARARRSFADCVIGKATTA